MWHFQEDFLPGRYEDDETKTEAKAADLELGSRRQP